jgi:GNAT superfamily N-acetyltransferase
LTGRPVIRVGRDDDSWDVIALIGACWSEYPGCVMDVHGECPDLLAPATTCRSAGGELWVATDRCGTVVATVGWTRLDPGTAELERLYVARRWRRHGLAAELATLAEDAARAAGATRIELWSDTRFTGAHRFYETRGYERAGPDRALGDLSHTREHHYGLILRPL